MDHVAVERPLLKYVMLQHGPLDGRVERIPREATTIHINGSRVRYLDSGQTLDGYPRFNCFIEEEVNEAAPASPLVERVD